MKLHRPIVFFDLETTGLDPQSDRIVEIAVIKLFPDGRMEEKVRRFNPLVPIPREATEVHGITDADVKDEPPFARVARSIAAYFAGCDLAGFNILHFDVPMLQAELKRANVPLDLADAAIVDACEIFKAKEPRNLEAAMRFYCAKAPTDLHSAPGDARAAFDVLAAQLDRYRELPSDPAGIDQSMRPPESVDRGGKLRWKDGKITVAFGRNKGRTLEFLALEEPEYLRWMIDNEVAPDANRILRDALIGHFAEPEAPSSDPPDPGVP